MFFAFNISTAVWILSSLAARYTGIESVKPFVEMGFASAFLMSYFFLIFCITFPQNLHRANTWLYVLFVVPAFFITISFLDLVAKAVPTGGTGFKVIPSQLYTYYSIFLASFIILGLGELIVKYKKYSGITKIQIFYVLLGFFLTALLALTTSLILPSLTNNPNIYKWGIYSVVLFLGFSSYAIVKYKFLDIKVFATATITFVIIIVLLVQALLSKTAVEALMRVLFLVMVSYFGYLLIKSVQKEIKQKMELGILAHELKETNLKLQQVDAMKTEFISLASHELLTPISAIEGYLSMMLDEKLVKIDDPKAIQYMQSVYKSAKRLARLVADLLNVSRIEQGRMLVEKKEVDLNKLVEEVVKELKFKVQEKHHKLLTNFRDNVDTKTYADEDKIKEVIINLAGNSIKYTNEGGLIGIGIDVWPTGEVQKHFDLMQSELKEHGKTSEGSLQNIVNEKLAEFIGERQIVIIVKDNGVGIAHGDVGKLFQKFSRVGDWSTQEVQGTGLGLYISRALVEMHHGRIWASSEGEGKGSTFYFSLPTLEAEEEIKQLDSQVPVAKDAKPMAKTMEKQA